MVALLDTNTGGFLCGGSLVETSVVLTAAHCVNRKAPGSITVRLSVVTRPTASQMRQEIFDYPIQVRLGEWDASSTSESINHQDILVNTVLIHPDYYPPGVFYDLALLRLQMAADTSKASVGVMCLPSAGQTFVLHQCQAETHSPVSRSHPSSR